MLEGTICLNGDTCEYGSAADDTECGDLCSTGACFESACIVTEAKDCSDGDACTDDECDPETGECAHPAAVCDDFQLRPLDSISLGPILAMASETDRAAAPNAACQTVRETYCPAGQTCAP